MSTVVADMSVSPDGFVADPDGGVDQVFAWYGKPQPAAQPVEPSVPVLLGDGIRLFGELAGGPVALENPTVVEGNGPSR